MEDGDIQRLINSLEFEKNPFGLFVPRTEGDEEGPDSEPASDPSFVLTTTGYNQAFGSPTSSVDGVVSLLSQVPLERVVDIVARMQFTLNAAPKEERWRSAQFRCAAGVFGQVETGRMLTRIRRAREGIDWDRTALFHHRQFLTLLKIAFLTMPVDGRATDRDDLSIVGKALLMVNDIIDAEDASVIGTPQLELHLFANALFHHGRSEVSEFARTWELFIEDHRDIPQYIDLRARLERVTGLNAEMAWFVTRALHGLFFVATGADAATRSIVANRDRFFTDAFDFSPEESGTFLRTCSRTSEEFRDLVSESYSLSSLQTFHVVPFARFPLVQFGSEVHCMSLDLLRDAAGTNLQHRFLDPSVFSHREREEFLHFRGRLFEDYLDRLLFRTFGPARYVSAQRLEAIAKAAGQTQSCDAVINYGDAALLIEYKAALVTLAARVGQSWDAYLTVIEKALIDAAQQLDATFQLIDRGACATEGIESGRLRRVVPIVVTMEISTNPGLKNRIDAELARRGLLTDRRFLPLQILHIDELEAIESAVQAGVSILDVFEQKAASPRTSAMSLKNYFFERGDDWVKEHNPYLAKVWHRVSERMSDFFHQRARSPS